MNFNMQKFFFDSNNNNEKKTWLMRIQGSNLIVKTIKNIHILFHVI